MGHIIELRFEKTESLMWRWYKNLLLHYINVLARTIQHGSCIDGVDCEGFGTRVLAIPGFTEV